MDLLRALTFLSDEGFEINIAPVHSTLQGKRFNLKIHRSDRLYTYISCESLMDTTVDRLIEHAERIYKLITDGAEV